MRRNAPGSSTVTVAKEIAEMVSPEAIEKLRPHMVEGQRIMVSARGITPVLRFALDEARLRKATLCVLFVKELAVLLPEGGRGVGRARWQEDPQAAAIMSLMLKLGQEVGVDVLPVYAVSTNPAGDHPRSRRDAGRRFPHARRLAPALHGPPAQGQRRR